MLELSWTDSGHAELLEAHGDQAVLKSSRPFPPGCPIEGTTPEGHSYRLKVRGSRKVDDSPLPFRVEARFVNLSRVQKEQLEQAFGPAAQV